VSGQPQFKQTAVRLTPFIARWHGFLLTRRGVADPGCAYWSRARRQHLWHYELAGTVVPDDWPTYARDLVGGDGAEDEWREFNDSTQPHYRAARFVDARLDSVLIVQPGSRLPPRDWLIDLFARERIESEERSRVLRGTPAHGRRDAGPIVCSCFSVGVNQLTTAIRERDLRTTEAVGELLQAGTNCGSCLPELRRLLAGR
jgi:assimilatory nitrate reductase catalytic subunit